MKKNTLVIAIITIIILVGGLFLNDYNKLVKYDESTKASWSQVENQYQRRSDLIPNLVNTVKGYASHEKETLQQVVEARSKATSIHIDPKNMNSTDMKQFYDAQGELSQALSRLMVVVEKYPDLKANENFQMLQAQIEGTENRISVERKRYNDMVNEYNTYLRKFPHNIVAGLFGFSKVDYFKSEEQAQKAPKVEF